MNFEDKDYIISHLPQLALSSIASVITIIIFTVYNSIYKNKVLDKTIKKSTSAYDDLIDSLNYVKTKLIFIKNEFGLTEYQAKINELLFRVDYLMEQVVNARAKKISIIVNDERPHDNPYPILADYEKSYVSLSYEVDEFIRKIRQEAKA